ncbi:fas-activated serine/threonine kinase [Hippocampus zosterae]|uniref:fas-activated serine/threonine kinase n=1 Tax=Hippocampus zosterae TaxID=109293 RepID=UPI00223D2B62|nr:fas-activated serine/threonine kinase [Hippocampus zosterae]XP_051944804.1 fas-activated serine/threonine kinase [Hippocampus zosterae]XP_051944805.1 fas-activated serine/threonine kinase [Hippocampus zosterae]
MLRWSNSWHALSQVATAASPTMYATRLYGAGGGGGVKPGKRGGLAMLEVPPSQPYHYRLPPPPPYPVPQGARFQPLAGTTPPMPPHWQPRAHLSTHTGAKKKTWNFIHEKMSYDTFFTMKRLIERSRRPDEVLRWLAQNPAKISHNHYAIALHKIAQLLQAAPFSPSPNDSTDASAACGRQVLEQQDFLLLCDAIVRDCANFDNFSIVNCLYAAAALGLPGDCPVVAALEAECHCRLVQFNQKDVSMVFSSSIKLHPGSQHPLTEACLLALEKNLERERHPQTLFLLLSYYRLKRRTSAQMDNDGDDKAAPDPQQVLANRKILRLVKHTLASVSGVRDQEMALLDEMLATCAREANNKSLEFIFSSHLFYQNRQERFIKSLADELPKKEDGLSAATMSLISKYVARHRLRETALLDAIAKFLVRKAEHLDSKVIQKLVFPFSRMSYCPSNEDQFFQVLEEVLESKALSSPLATVNILMSLFQLGRFPGAVLHRVFSPTFISNVTNSPYALIVRRYLSLLDAALQLEHPHYQGPRLHPDLKVLMFHQALTADEVNRKYSYKGVVAEALRQLLGEENYKRDQVLAPGYYTDFVLWMDSSGRVLPIQSRGPSVPGSAPVCAPQEVDDIGVLSTSFAALDAGAREAAGVAETTGGAVEPGAFLPQHTYTLAGGAHIGDSGDPSDSGPQYYVPVAEYHSLESQDSSTLSSPPSDGQPPPGDAVSGGVPAAGDPLFQFSIGKMLVDEERAGSPTDQGTTFYEAGISSHVPVAEGEATEPTNPPQEDKQIRRLVISVNDKWHYCHNSSVLVGSRAMRDRHLKLLGYAILQLPYHELEKLNGIEEVKTYLRAKLYDIPP